MLRRTIGCRIVTAMSEADELAQRFLALWTEYLTALAAEPHTVEPLYRWLAALGGVADAPRADDRPTTGAAAVAGASDERDDALAELSRRVDDLARRLDALEHGRPGRRSTRRGTGRRMRPPRA